MIGIMPAAGHATRIWGVPKLLLPTPAGVLIDVLADRLRAACTQIYTGTRSGLFDLLTERVTAPDHAVYLANTQTMSETVRIAQPFVGDQPIAFGMPDTWFDDDAAFVKLAAALDGGADVAVGVFRARFGQHTRGGMVDMDGTRVRAVVDKPATSGLAWIWGVLAWRAAFWPLIDPTTPHVGYALPEAIRAGLDVRGVILSGQYWDCGTPTDYFDCIEYQRARRAA